MTTNASDPDTYPPSLPRLSDEAVIQIRHFIEYLLDQFDVHYGDQVHRFDEDRAQHNMIRPSPPPAVDDPPF